MLQYIFPPAPNAIKSFKELLIQEYYRQAGNSVTKRAMNKLSALVKPKYNWNPDDKPIEGEGDEFSFTEQGI